MRTVLCKLPRLAAMTGTETTGPLEFVSGTRDFQYHAPPATIRTAAIRRIPARRRGCLGSTGRGTIAGPGTGEGTGTRPGAGPLLGIGALLKNDCIINTFQPNRMSQYASLLPSRKDAGLPAKVSSP